MNIKILAVIFLSVVGFAGIVYCVPSIVADIATSNEQGCGYDKSFNGNFWMYEYHSTACANSALDTGQDFLEPVCAGYDTNPADFCVNQDLIANGLLNNALLEGTQWYPYGSNPLWGFPFGTCIPPGSLECQGNSECAWQGEWGSTCNEKEAGTPLDNVIIMHKNCPECNYICKCDPYNTYKCSEDYEYPCPFCVLGDPGSYLGCQAEADCITDDDCEQPLDTCQERVCINNICQEQQKAEGSSCTTGEYCTLGETCDASGVCQGGVPRDCSTKCESDVYYSNGYCDDIQDACVYNEEDCSGADGWHATGNTRLADDPDEVCKQIIENEEAYREDFRCEMPDGCTYDTGTTRWVDSGTTQDRPNGILCPDENLCDGDVCQNGACITQPPIDCSSNNIPMISTCNYDPDAIPYTLDVFSGFISECDPDTGSCSEGSISLTHACDVDECGVNGAQCDITHDCPDTECDQLDACEGSTFQDFHDKENACSGCLCENNPCSSTPDEIIPDYGGCIEGKVESFASLTIKFPDIAYGLVATKNGKADFTRGQNVKTDFNAVANVGGHGEVECNGIMGACAGAVVTYSITNIDSGAEFVTDKIASWSDAVLAWRDMQATDSRFACDSWYLLDGRISLMVDGYEKTAVNSIEFYVNCVPKIILQPLEKKYALGAGPDKLFDVLLINPFADDKTFELVVVRSADDNLNALGVEFNDPLNPDSDKETMRVLVKGIDYAGDKHESVSLWMTKGAQRAGSYYITILDDTFSVSKMGLVSVFAESITEFGFVQFLGLLASAGIILLIV